MAQTVAGPVPADALGVTMMHEHLLIDTTPMLVEPREASRRTAFHAPLTVDLLGRIRYGGLTNVDNSRSGRRPRAIEEAMLYKQAGGPPSSMPPASGSAATRGGSRRSPRRRA